MKWLLAARGVVMGGERPFAVEFFDLPYFGLELLLLQGVGLMQKEIHNYPSWSISVEFWMYGLFGLFLLGAAGKCLRTRRRSLPNGDQCANCSGRGEGECAAPDSNHFSLPAARR